MTTTGQLLVSLSGLPSGSALAHLLAIQTGAGTGTGETIYAHRMMVVTEHRLMTVTSRGKRSAPQQVAVQPAKTPQKQGSKHAHVFTPTSKIEVLSSGEMIFVTEKVSSGTVSTKVPAVSVSRRKV